MLPYSGVPFKPLHRQSRNSMKIISLCTPVTPIPLLVSSVCLFLYIYTQIVVKNIASSDRNILLVILDLLLYFFRKHETVNYVTILNFTTFLSFYISCHFCHTKYNVCCVSDNISGIRWCRCSCFKTNLSHSLQLISLLREHWMLCK